MNKDIKISYQDPFGLWPTFYKEFKDFLPLQSLQIRLPSRPLSIISHLDINFIGYNEYQEQFKHLPSLSQPLQNIFLMGYETIETYRSVIRPQIREWFNSLPKDSEFLIIFITNSQEINKLDFKSSHNRSTSFQSITGSNLLLSSFKKNAQYLTLFEKIKLDFNDGKKDRVSSLTLNLNKPEPNYESIMGLVELLKESICFNFQNKFGLLQEEVNKLDSQRRFKGWNLAPFFAVKDQLARALIQIHLFKEALKLYDEMEALLFHCNEEDLNLWFLPDPRIEEIDLDKLLLTNIFEEDKILDISKNQISYFDLQLYLFSQQLQLLKKMDSMIEFGGRSLKFLNTFQLYINKKENSTEIQLFSYSWGYLNSQSLYTDIDDHFETMKTKDISKASSLINLNTIKSSIIYFAKSQLEKIGIILNYLPKESPFFNCFKKHLLNEIVPSEDNLKYIHNEGLKNHFSSIDSFDSLYLSLNSKLISDYSGDKKKRNISLIQTYMASLHYYRKRYKYTINILENSVYEYIDESWIFTSFELISKLILSYKFTIQYPPIVRLCLRVLKSINELKQEQIEFFINNLIESSDKIKEEITAKAQHYFKIIDVEKGTKSDNNLFCIKLKIKNKLNKELPIKFIKAFLTGNENSKLTFLNDSPITLLPGLNEITLKCENFMIGKYFVDKIQIYINKICFNYDVIDEQIILSLKDYPQHLDIVSELYTDGLILNLYNNNNLIVEGEVQLDILDLIQGFEIKDNYFGFILNNNNSNDNEDIQFILINSYINLNNHLCFVIPNIKPNQNLKIMISGHILLALDIQMMIPYTINYVNSNKDDIIYKGLLKMYMLPYPFKLDDQIILNINNINEMEYLQFIINTISKTTPYKIKGIKLFLNNNVNQIENKDLSLLSFNNNSYKWIDPIIEEDEIILLPNHHITYLFKMDMEWFENYSEILIKIQYTTYKEEIKTAILTLLNKHFDIQYDLNLIFRTLEPIILESGRILDYVITSEFKLNDIIMDDLDLSYITEPSLLKWMKNNIPVFFKSYPTLTQQDINLLIEESNNLEVHTLLLKKEIKLPKYFITIDVNHNHTNMLLGSHYSIEYTINSVNFDDELWFQLESDDIWLISGKIKFKLDFKSNNEQKISIQITPIKTGYLKLPTLNIIHSESEAKKIPKPIFTGISASPTISTKGKDFIVYDKSIYQQIQVNNNNQNNSYTVYLEEEHVDDSKSILSQLSSQQNSLIL